MDLTITNPKEGPGPPGERGRVLDRLIAGHQRPVPEVRERPRATAPWPSGPLIPLTLPGADALQPLLPLPPIVFRPPAGVL